eukprot:1701612-Prymnesium_polylepis.1
MWWGEFEYASITRRLAPAAFGSRDGPGCTHREGSVANWASPACSQSGREAKGTDTQAKSKTHASKVYSVARTHLKMTISHPNERAKHAQNIAMLRNNTNVSDNIKARGLVAA